MRGKFLVLFLAQVICLCVSSTQAQVEEQKAQLWFVEEVVVKPSMVEKYEAHTKEALGLCEKYEIPFPFYVFTTDDFHYYFLWPIENYESLDSLFKAIGEWVAKIGDENWQALVKSGEGTYEYMKWSIVRHKPELSYNPEKRMATLEEPSFVYLNFYYILSGKEVEFERALKEGVAFYKQIDFPFGFDVYVGDMGTEMPMYVYISQAKDATEFYAKHDDAFRLHTEEATKLRLKILVAIRKIDVKTGMYRSDLSYIPKEKQFERRTKWKNFISSLGIRVDLQD